MRIRYTVDVNIKYITIRDRTINISKLLVEKFGHCYLETNQSRLNKRLHSFYPNEWYITFFYKPLKQFNVFPPSQPSSLQKANHPYTKIVTFIGQCNLIQAAQHNSIFNSFQICFSFFCFSFFFFMVLPHFKYKICRDLKR